MKSSAARVARHKAALIASGGIKLSMLLPAEIARMLSDLVASAGTSRRALVIRLITDAHKASPAHPPKLLEK